VNRLLDTAPRPAQRPDLPARLSFHEPGEAGYRRMLLGLFAAGVATFAALYSTQPLIGILAQRFAVSPAHAAWSVSIATLLLGLGMLAAGSLSGRWGRSRTIIWSLFLTALLGALCALAPSWPVLLAARAVQGLTLAGTPAVALVYLREEVHPSVAPRATGLYIGGTALGGMTGRLLAGAVADLGGWRWAVGAVAILSGACAVVALLCLPAPRHPERAEFLAAAGDATAAPASGAGAAVPAAAAASASAPASATGVDPEPAAAVGRAPRLRPALRRTWRVLADPGLLGLYLISATMMGAFVAIYNVLGLRLTAQPYHLSVFQASLVFCVYPLGSVSSALAGRLAERAGRPVVVLTGCLVALAGIAVTLAAPLPLVILGTAVVTVGFFAAHGVASGWAAALGQRGHGDAAQASALYLLAYYLGSSIFGEFGTSLWSSGRWPSVVALAAALMLVAALAAARPVLKPLARPRHRA
jgi:YNFM family putative membrane transporter